MELNSRTLTFISAIVLLAFIRVGVAIAKRRGIPVLDGEDEGSRWSLTELLVVSFLTLFAELALIRWIAVEVRVFAYVKNLALLLCFVGFGLGCAMAGKRMRWFSGLASLMGLLLIVNLPYGQGMFLESLSQDLGAGFDFSVWHTAAQSNWNRFPAAALLAAMIFLLLASVFVPIGQRVSRLLDAADNALRAYSWNLAGSILGILAFLLASRLMLAPSFWFSVVILCFAWLQRGWRTRVAVASLVVPALLLLYQPQSSTNYAVWSPYQQIHYRRTNDRSGQFLIGRLWINKTFYQSLVDLSQEFLSRHPKLLKEAVEENPYNLPLRFAAPQPRVLIVGAGTGNDVAGALRGGAASVDAVEIDPEILAIGKQEHPERPYDSPRVSLHLTDARAFLKRAQGKYDLILFGLLDSHTGLSDFSNVRIDNFVYTMESFREAARLLQPNGVIFVKFQADRPWLTERLTEMLRGTFGKAPLVFSAVSSYSTDATCFAISPGSEIDERFAADPNLAQFVHANTVTPNGKAVPVTTDDWPYLYHEGKWIPRTFYVVGLLVALVAVILYFQTGQKLSHPPSMFFFMMGGGFILMETQLISRLALFFGTVWQVNGIVMCAVLIALLLANAAVAFREEPWPRRGVVAALLIALGLAYFIPFERIPAAPAVAGAIAAAVFSIPVFFAGILFATEFRTVSQPGAALGANILGAVLGGMLENLSFVFGMRSLLVVAAGLYCLAAVGLWRGKSAAGVTAEPLQPAGSAVEG